MNHDNNNNVGGKANIFERLHEESKVKTKK